jgi:hypothetical protein
MQKTPSDSITIQGPYNMRSDTQTKADIIGPVRIIYLFIHSSDKDSELSLTYYGKVKHKRVDSTIKINS